MIAIKTSFWRQQNFLQVIFKKEKLLRVFTSKNNENIFKNYLRESLPLGKSLWEMLMKCFTFCIFLMVSAVTPLGQCLYKLWSKIVFTKQISFISSEPTSPWRHFQVSSPTIIDLSSQQKKKN